MSITSLRGRLYDFMVPVLPALFCIIFGGLGLMEPGFIGSIEYRLLGHYYVSYPSAMILYAVFFVAGLIPVIMFLYLTSTSENTSPSTKTLERVRTDVLLGQNGVVYLVIPAGRLQPGKVDLFFGDDMILVSKQEGAQQ